MRRLLCHEPRGHADMYGCFLVPPDDDGADLGVLFWHKDGYSTACGHGTIALGAWAVQSGRVAAPDDGEATVTIDVPSGRVTAPVRMSAAGRRRASRSATSRRSCGARVGGGGCRGRRRLRGSDLRVRARGAVGLARCPGGPAQLIATGRAVKGALDGTEVARHPDDDRPVGDLRDGLLRGGRARLHQRTVAIFADGEVDRSPTGSATSARDRVADRRRIIAEAEAPGERIRSSARRFTRARSGARPRACSPRCRERRFARAASLLPRSSATRLAPGSCFDDLSR